MRVRLTVGLNSIRSVDRWFETWVAIKLNIRVRFADDVRLGVEVSSSL